MLSILSFHKKPTAAVSFCFLFFCFFLFFPIFCCRRMDVSDCRNNLLENNKEKPKKNCRNEIKNKNKNTSLVCLATRRKMFLSYSLCNNHSVPSLSPSLFLALLTFISIYLTTNERERERKKKFSCRLQNARTLR